MFLTVKDGPAKQQIMHVVQGSIRLGVPLKKDCCLQQNFLLALFLEGVIIYFPWELSTHFVNQQLRKHHPYLVTQLAYIFLSR